MSSRVGVIGVDLTILGQLVIRCRTDVEPPNETAPSVSAMSSGQFPATAAELLVITRLAALRGAALYDFEQMKVGEGGGGNGAGQPAHDVVDHHVYGDCCIDRDGGKTGRH